MSQEKLETNTKAVTEINSSESKSIFKLPKEIQDYFVEIFAVHNCGLPKNTPFIEKVNINISLDNKECIIQTSQSSFDSAKSYLEQPKSSQQ